MSYILEALKKAQAERQLGSAPTIHSMPIQAPVAAHAAGSRTPLWIALACATLLIAGGAVAWWRQTAPAAPAAPPAVLAVLPAPVASVPPLAPPAPPPLPAARPAPPPRALTPPAKAIVARAVPAPVPVPFSTPPATPPAPVAQAAAPEESPPFLHQLPEPQQRDVPKVTFGGYMYSKNPADRLLLIDKVLRHEGEEVVPGLILEQLQPKAAVMNYRGTRYRVAY